ncbi:MAG: hypothetical protein QOD42_1444 [Sphingomonadales bacterium]|jgi:hypothetical protein|nr:hypothetical protein [Sphingomonadales bacterium]
MDFEFNKAKGSQLKVLRHGLLATYTRRTLKMLLMDEFERDYENLVEKGSFDEEVFELVLTAKREGWLDRFVQATAKLYPDAPGLRTVFETFALLESATKSAPPPVAAADVREEDPPLERLIRRASPTFTSPLQWGERLNAMRSRVCRVDAGKWRGSGCLIGKDLVITCDHVVGQVEDPADTELRFDYVIEQNKTLEGRTCKLADDWIVARQPFDLPGGAGRGLNFIVMRLAEPVGHDILSNGEPRGWVPLPTGTPIEIGDPVFILQHPHSGPLMMSAGSVVEWDEGATRFATDADTQPGSSGAPVFDAGFELIGLHESAQHLSGKKSRTGEVRADLIGQAVAALEIKGGADAGR